MQSINPIGGPFVWAPQGLHTLYPDLELKRKVPMRNKHVVKHRSGNQKRNEKTPVLLIASVNMRTMRSGLT